MIRDIEEDQLYETKYGSRYRVKYCDEYVVLFEDLDRVQNGQPVHRMEDRSQLENMIESGHTKYDGEAEDLDPDTIQWSQINLIGSTVEERLYNHEIETIEDMKSISVDELREIDGVGSTAASNLKEFVE